MEVFHKDKGHNCALIAIDELRIKKKIKFTENEINRRAAELGLTKPRQSPFFWSNEEDQFLSDNIAVPARELHTMFNSTPGHQPRTISAIVARIGRIGGVRELLFAHGYTATELSKKLHISKQTLDRMTSVNMIAGEKPNGRDWHFTKENIRKFIANHPDQIDITKVDKYWLIELLTFDLKK